ncbi:sugar ABC transporter ATP-binding protein [Mycetocola zhadangensis]|uniref:Sugar ABC transporter ATP-binding protein n=1 Tax=Mycetocola zhadangensis TaxID=1164595 RepID=A0A3L7J0C8_9MICO|nr:sugar ABC transporter ATP-binding protein [Mycetocola zhadangensis]RLQ83898.1 sugar ABC transporter ATP-binding protein [Mycetocola zhadangensis]GGE97914.1 ribose import ATP-binding protein RbsA 1 [Mycetocola zhadangensis]
MSNTAEVVGSVPRVELSGIVKTYGGVRAIRNADLSVAPGTVHALVGENGAGKSTLIKILAGAERADAGSLQFNGEPVSITSTTDALGLGVQTVYQEPQLFPELSVAENVFVGRELRRGIRVDWAAQAEQMNSLLDTVGLDVGIATRTVGDLSIAQQQQVSIAKALAGEARVLILDEPSAILTDAEIDVLFAVIRRLTATGVSVIYISHRLDELFRIADVVTIMRDGETITTRPIGELTVREIAELMVGGVLAEPRADVEATRGDVVLQLDDMSLAGSFSEISLDVRAGEIVGLYGLIGSGAGEIASTIYGMQRPTGGRMLVRGEPVVLRRPSSAKKRGIHLLPANRSAQGSFSFQSIAFNITIGELHLLSRIKGWVQRRAERDIARNFITRLAVKTPSERQPISAMSGGNAQKVVLARQLVNRPELLVLVEPTQGVDVGAKEEIHRIIDDLASEGTAVLVVTSDLGEVLRISDRIIVIRSGEIAHEFTPDATQVEILAAAAGETHGSEEPS